MIRSIACLALAACLAACTGGPTQTKTGSSPKPSASKGVVEALKVPLTGTVVSAAGIIAQGAGNIIAQGAGNLTGTNASGIIAQGAGNLMPGRQLFAITESSLANAEVFLATPDGKPIAGLKTAMTDAKGAFTLPDVPVGGTVVVATRIKTKDGKDALMETLAVPTEASATAGMSTATTLVARAVLGSAGAKPGLVDVANWVETVEICKDQLNPGKWPDLADQAAIDGWMDDLTKELPDMDSHVKKLKANLKGT